METRTLTGRRSDERPRTGRGRVLAGLLATLLLAVGAASCAQGSEAGAGTGQPTARATPSVEVTPRSAATPSPTSTIGTVCADAAALQKSLNTLMNLDFTGTGGVLAAISKVQSDVQALRGSVKAEWKQQVNALSRELTTLRAAVRDLSEQKNSSTAWQSVRDAAAGVGASADRLRASLSSICPGLRGQQGR